MTGGERPWEWRLGEGPVVATAIHHGHAMRPELAEWCLLDRMARLREEDPHTGPWTRMGDQQLVVHRSRFEVDFNRTRERAVYRSPGEAWGLRVWHEATPERVWEESYALHDRFYRELEGVLRGLEERYGGFVVLDLHSYNHRRGGPRAPGAEVAANPGVDVATAHLGAKWRPLVEGFLGDLREGAPSGGTLDVRENVRFPPGAMPEWIMERFPDTACVLPVEVKKEFMDEWSGELDVERHGLVGEALAATLPGLRERLGRL